jgi:hypothetical protein
MSIAQAACRQALAMGLDVSGSVDAGEYQLQLQGLAAALTSPDITSSILSVPSAPVRLLVYEWSGQNYQRILIPWTEISNLKTLQNLSTKLHQVQRQDAPPTTALGKAIQIDNIVINALVIGVDAGSRLSHAELSISELTAYFSNRVLAGPSAFSEVAVGFADYERAMSRKLLRELELISMSKLDQ